VRWEAARALANQTQDPQQALPRLTAALRSEDPFLRGFAAWRLGEMGAAAAPAVPALVEALGRDEGYGRGGASGALAKIGPAAAAAVPALVEGLKSDDGDRRWKAARTLGRIGPAARDAAPALIASISDPNEHVRAHAVRALARVASRSPEIERALARARRDRVAAVAKEARVATQEMGIAPPGDALRARPLAAVGVGAAMALLATLALTPWVRDAARRRGWLDAPDGRLKTHAVAVPHVGGVATYLAFGVGLVASAHPAWGGGWQGGALFVAMGAVLLVGLAHDLSPIWAPVRLALQAAAALGLCAQAGVVRTIAMPGGGAFDLGVFGWPLTVLWLVGVSNAFNLIDGLDGLAAGSGSLSLGVLVVAALAHGDPSAPAAAALAGALLGFLRYNRSPASIFLGDAGSLSVGFALAALALQTTTNDAGEMALTVAVLALGLPLAEGAFTLWRRLRLGRSLLTRDRGHLHDRLLARGLDRETAARALVSFGGTCACLGWLLAVARPQSKAWALAGALVSLAVGLWSLRRARAAPSPPNAAEATGASRS
jgi:UDP-GlcNAc:undecaprenyl-phosphate GlcNAc-1-phosphate transferase